MGPKNAWNVPLPDPQSWGASRREPGGPIKSDADLRSFLVDVQSVLEFVTQRITDLDLKESEHANKSSLNELVTTCKAASRAPLELAVKGRGPGSKEMVVSEVNWNPPTAAAEVADKLLNEEEEELESISSKSQTDEVKAIDRPERNVKIKEEARSPLSKGDQDEHHFWGIPAQPTKLLSKGLSVLGHMFDKTERTDCVVRNLTQTMCEAGSHWEPLDTSRIQKRTWFLAARFYWLGLTKNMEFRSIHMAFKEKLNTISQDAQQLHTGDRKKHFHQLTSRARVLRKSVTVKFEGSHHFPAPPEDTLKEAEGDDDAAIALCHSVLHRLEKLLQKDWDAKGRFATHTFRSDILLQMASCPLDDFVERYTAERDAALSRTEPREQRRELTKVAVRAVAGVDILCDAFHERINQNDEMPFKLLLCLMHVASIATHYLIRFVFPDMEAYLR